eukprot:1174784-Amphidinium_carterae.1
MVARAGGVTDGDLMAVSTRQLFVHSTTDYTSNHQMVPAINDKGTPHTLSAGSKLCESSVLGKRPKPPKNRNE